MKFIFILLPILTLICTGCEEKVQKKPGESKPALEFSMLYDSSLQDYVKPLTTSFQQSGPALPDGQKILLSLFTAEPLQGMKSVAEGKIKADLWLTSSEVYVNWANNHLENLGARHEQCTSLFRDSITLVAQKELLENSPAAGKLFPLAQSAPAFGIKLSHLVPGVESSGIFSTAQMLLAINGPEALTGEGYKQAESLIELYAPNAEELLASQVLTQNALAISAVAESDFNTFAQKNKLTRLSPPQGNLQMTYQICHSTGDWVTPARKYAATKLVEWFKSQASLKKAQGLGFQELSSEDQTKDAPSLSPSQLQTLDEDWKKFHRQSSLAVVVDRSGSIDPVHLSSAQRALRYLFAKRNEREETSLITITTEPELDFDFTTDAQKLTKVTDELYPLGGSSLYDALRLAYDQFLSENFKTPLNPDARKIVLVISDGGDTNSRMSYESVKHLVKTRSEKSNIKLIVLALPGDKVELEKLKSLTEASAGIFINTSGYEIEKFIDKYAL